MDIVLTTGVLFLVLSVPALLAGWSDNQLSRIGAAMLAGGVALLLLALVAKPGGYRPGDVPVAMLEVLARLVN